MPQAATPGSTRRNRRDVLTTKDYECRCSQLSGRLRRVLGKPVQTIEGLWQSIEDTKAQFPCPCHSVAREAGFASHKTWAATFSSYRTSLALVRVVRVLRLLRFH